MNLLVSAKQLKERFPDASVEEKNYLIEVWSELHYQAKGVFPNSYDLIMLADWLMEEQLMDRRTNKVQFFEYPVLSKYQMQTRYREISMEADLVDVLHQRKVTNQPTRKKDAKNIEY